MTPYIQKVPLAPCKAKIEIFSKSDAPVMSTNGLYEVHERFAGDEAEYEADADVEGVAQGPDLGWEELGHDDPDESAVAAVAEEQEDQDSCGRDPAPLEPLHLLPCLLSESTPDRDQRNYGF